MNESGGSHEAVFFYQESDISKEMTYAEFEAVLDGVVGMSDFAGQRLEAAYALISPQLTVKGAAFFTVEFDESGCADTSWNLPLRTLVDRAEFGPDMGAGAFRLSCYSRCSNDNYKDWLWDPTQQDVVNLLKHVAVNRLCLPVDQSAGSHVQEPVASGWQPAPQQQPTTTMNPALLNALESEHQTRLASLILEQRQQLESISNETQQHLKKVSHSHEKDLSIANLQLEKIRAEHEKLQAQYIALSQQLDEARRQSQASITEMENFKQSQLKEVDVKVEQRTESLNKEAQSLRLKLKLRDDEVLQMREELMALRKDKLRLTQEGGGKFLERLENLGINFIAFHPGAGHLSIALKDMTDYMENPIAFAARKCKVTEAHYSEWLVHYQNPECRAPLTNEKVCGCRIPRVDNPANYVTGKSDRCDKHKVHSTDSSFAHS